MTDKSFNDRLQGLINELTEGNKKKLAEMLDINPVMIQGWINRGSLPSTEHLINIQQKLGINLNWLLAGEGERYIKRETAVEVKEEEEHYYSQEEKQYIKKLIQIFRTKQEKTVSAIKQNIDAFLDNPNKGIVKKSIINE